LKHQKSNFWTDQNTIELFVIRISELFVEAGSYKRFQAVLPKGDEPAGKPEDSVSSIHILQ